MNKGTWLRVSLGFNVTLILLAAYAWIAPEGEHSSPTAESERTAPAPAGPPASKEELRAEVARLRALGLSREETMPIVADTLKRRASAGAPANNGKFWESGWQSISRETAVARAQQTEAIRGALLSIYGADAENAAALREFFRPLEATYPFLNPAEQRAIAQFRLSRSAPMPMGTASRMPPRAAVSHTEFMASLPATLSSTSVFEFALRESPLASRIRAADADLTELEFRALFAAMADSERNRMPVPLDIAGGKVPKAKVLKIVAQSDPAWAGLRSATARTSISEAQLWAVYEIIRDTNQSVAGLDAPTPERVQKLVASMQERDRRIAQLVGDEPAASLINALNETYRSFAMRSTQPGAPVPSVQ